jgi:hypothetical protein
MRPHPHDLPVAAKVGIWSNTLLILGSVLVVLIVLITVFGAAMVIDRRNLERLSRFPVVHGRARVTRVTFTPGRSSLWQYLQLSIGDKQAVVKSQATVVAGDTVRVTYREDEAGDVVIQSIDGVEEKRRRP